MAKKNEIKKSETEKKIFIISISIIIFLSLLLIISRNFGNFNNVRLRKNNKTIFSVSDLTVSNLKYGDTEDVILKQLGKPQKIKEDVQNVYKYKILYYDGLKLTLKENYADFMLVKAEITSPKYKTSRGIKVNNRILRVMRSYKVENSTGTYIYGNYTTNLIDNMDVKDPIYMGVRSNSEVVYINRDSVVSEISPNIARLVISYKYGKVTKITWSYDFK